MSQEEGVSRKEKRAQRDAERQKQHTSKKRKRVETEEEGAKDDAPERTVEQRQSTKTPAEASKKRKAGDELIGEATVEKIPKSTKRRKTTAETADAAADDNNTTVDKPQKPSKSRFIVFVGNLPFKTTDDSLRIHFKKLEPFTLRHRTDPKTKKSKGFAFLEFENYDRMKTCLKLYHHSMFDPADPTAGETAAQEDTSRRGKKSQARRINVELTAGGGGKTEGRQAKIKAKNVKLEEERKRRAEAERKEKARKEKKEGEKAKKQEEADADTGASGESHGIHPSRLARIHA